MAVKLQATKKPTGLSITRNKLKYICEWKIADADYKDGQWFEKTLYFGKKVTNGGITSNVASFTSAQVKISAKDTKRTIELTASDWYPTTSKRLGKIRFGVKGDRKKFDYTEKGKTKHYDPAPSDWSYQDFIINPPKKPIVTRSWSASAQTTAVFTATVNPKNDDHYPFTRIQWQTIRVKNASAVDVKSAASYNWSSSAAGWDTGTTTSNTCTVTKTEPASATATADTSYTRFVRFRTQGVGGESEWVYSYHTYGVPFKPEAYKPTIAQADGQIVLDVKFNTPSNASHPIDSGGVALKYAIEVPAAGLTKTSSSWEQATSQSNTNSEKYGGVGDRFYYETGQTLQDDECVFYRLEVTHDNHTIASDTYLKYVGYVADPTLVSVTANWTNMSVQVVAKNLSSIPDSRVVVVCSYGGKEEVIKVSNTQSVTGSSNITLDCTIPANADEDSASFGVYAVVGDVSGTSIKPYSGKRLMRSKNTFWQSGSPVAPATFTVDKADIEETALLTWAWSWAEADSAQITWSDNPLAWESNDEPSEYMVSSFNPSHWYISGLKEGKKWYFRVRLCKTVGEDIVYGAWTPIESIDLRSAPNKPVLQLSESVITDEGTTQAYWAYVTTDGTPQSRADLCEAVLLSAVQSPSGNPYSQGWYEKDVSGLYQLTADTECASGKAYYALDDSGTLSHLVPFATAETEQHIDIDAKAQGWAEGTEHLLCVRVTSESGINSEGWSDPVTLNIAERLVAVIASDNLEEVDLSTETSGELEGTEYRMTELPLEIQVTGAGAGVTTIAVERAEDYPIERPDETTVTGYEGETVILTSENGEPTFSIGVGDLIGHLDDGARYRIVATVSDDYGQSASVEKEFVVRWGHQAVMPTGEVMLEDKIAVIFPSVSENVPSGWELEDGDCADIYRLSADRPELILENVELNTAYVDPYPAIDGGYRIVFKTLYGDYIIDEDEDNGKRMAWVDVESGFEHDRMIIDFGGDSAELYYNVDEDDNWSKDFQATKYLGGSIVGDWNPPVERSADVSAVVVPILEETTVDDLRRLADYAGAVHVRTLSGGSYTANVDVKRTKSHEHFGTRYSYGLSITKVDPQGYDGMRYTDYYTSLGYLLDENGNRIVDENGAYIIANDI